MPLHRKHDYDIELLSEKINLRHAFLYYIFVNKLMLIKRYIEIF